MLKSSASIIAANCASKAPAASRVCESSVSSSVIAVADGISRLLTSAPTLDVSARPAQNTIFRGLHGRLAFRQSLRRKIRYDVRPSDAHCPYAGFDIYKFVAIMDVLF